MRRRRRRKNSQRKIIITVSLCLLFVMTVGYAAFQTNLNITAKGNAKGKVIAAEQLISTAVTTGDGLYLDTYESDENEQRYVYKGANPNNYITFNGELWRIISVEKDKTLKLFCTTYKYAYEPFGARNWSDSPFQKKLNTEYYDGLSEETKKLIQEHSWGIGSVTPKNTDLAAQIVSENGATWTGNIGLISASDYVRGNSNMTECGNLQTIYDNRSTDTCKATNYLALSSSYNTISTSSTDSTDVLHNYGKTTSTGTTYGYLTVWDISSTAGLYNRIALYLIKDIFLEGEGTEENPYIIQEI